MTPSRAFHAIGTKTRRLVAALSIMGLALIALVAMPGAAVAAPNPGIVVGAVTIAPAGAQATVGDTLTVSGDWDARTADPQAGDTFTIGASGASDYLLSCYAS